MDQVRLIDMHEQPYADDFTRTTKQRRESLYPDKVDPLAGREPNSA